MGQGDLEWWVTALSGSPQLLFVWLQAKAAMQAASRKGMRSGPLLKGAGGVPRVPDQTGYGNICLRLLVALYSKAEESAYFFSQNTF